MQKTKPNKRKLRTTSEDRRNIESRRKRVKKGVQTKSTPNFLRHSSFTLKANLKDKDLNFSKQINYNLVKEYFIKGIIHSVETYNIDFGIDEFNDVTLSELYNNIIVNGEYEIIKRQDKFYIVKYINEVNGYSAELKDLYSIKWKKKKSYKLLTGCLNLLFKDLVFYKETWHWEMVVDMYSKEGRKEYELEYYNFTKSNNMMEDIKNSKVTKEDIINALSNKRFKKYHKIFELTLKLCENPFNIWSYVKNDEGYSDPISFAMFHWSFDEDDAAGNEINEYVNNDWNNNDENWFHVEYGQSDVPLKLYFDYLYQFCYL